MKRTTILAGLSAVFAGTVVAPTAAHAEERTCRGTIGAARVVGNVQGEGHRRVVVRRSQVGGSIQLVQGRSAVVRRNRVTGDVQSFSNRGRQLIARNWINGNLQCKQNNPAPVGGGNVVGGNKEDQCRRL